MNGSGKENASGEIENVRIGCGKLSDFMKNESESGKIGRGRRNGSDCMTKRGRKSVKEIDGGKLKSRKKRVMRMTGTSTGMVGVCRRRDANAASVNVRMMLQTVPVKQKRRFYLQNLQSARNLHLTMLWLPMTLVMWSLKRRL
jgi:hypothetical protein